MEKIKNNSEIQQNVPQQLPPRPRKQAGRRISHSFPLQYSGSRIRTLLPPSQLSNWGSRGRAAFPERKRWACLLLAPSSAPRTPCLHPGGGVALRVPSHPRFLCPGLNTLAQDYFLLRGRKKQPSSLTFCLPLPHCPSLFLFFQKGGLSCP